MWSFPESVKVIFTATCESCEYLTEVTQVRFEGATEVFNLCADCVHLSENPIFVDER